MSLGLGRIQEQDYEDTDVVTLTRVDAVSILFGHFFNIMETLHFLKSLLGHDLEAVFVVFY